MQYNVGIDMDDMDFLEGITSCNKVENVVMLSEYEQNLIKECEDTSSTSAVGRGLEMGKASSTTKKWPFKGPPSTTTRNKKKKRWNQVLPGPSRSITTIEENATAAAGSISDS